MRVITGAPDGDGAAAGVDVLIDDSTGAVVQMLPQAIGLSEQPARLVLDVRSDATSTTDARPRFGVIAGDGIVASGGLDSSSTPLVLEPGDYTIRAAFAVPGGFPDARCDLPLSLAAADDVAYYAEFSGRDCTGWKQGEWPFN